MAIWEKVAVMAIRILPMPRKKPCSADTTAQIKQWHHGDVGHTDLHRRRVVQIHIQPHQRSGHAQHQRTEQHNIRKIHLQGAEQSFFQPLRMVGAHILSAKGRHGTLYRR